MDQIIYFIRSTLLLFLFVREMTNQTPKHTIRNATKILKCIFLVINPIVKFNNFYHADDVNYTPTPRLRN